MATRQRKILDVPLTPALLEQIGMFSALPERAPDHAPERGWEGTYQIWVCHGYDTRGNWDTGTLHIRREPGGDDAFILSVTQKIVLLQGVASTTHALVECRNDGLATPMRCTLENRFEDSDGHTMDDLGSTYEATLQGGQWHYSVNGTRGTKEVAGALSSDWSLFDAVQRLPFDSPEARFDLLEHMTVLKPGQVLRYREDLSERIAFQDLRLQCFSRHGYATVPQEYWVDEAHRLVMVVAYNMVYLLNDDAPALYERELYHRREAQ